MVIMNISGLVYNILQQEAGPILLTIMILDKEDFEKLLRLQKCLFTYFSILKPSFKG